MNRLLGLAAVAALLTAGCTATGGGMGGAVVQAGGGSPLCGIQNAGVGTVSISFDDGSKGQLEALQYEICGTLFLNPSYIINDDSWYLNWNDVAAFRRAGWELGCHGYEHVDHATLGADEVRLQVEQCTTALIDYAGVDPHVYAVPYGSTSEYVNAALLEWGYSVNAIVDGQFQGATATNPTIVTRVDVLQAGVAGTCAEVRDAGAGGYHIILMFHDIGPQGGEWVTSTADFASIVACISTMVANGEVNMAPIGAMY